jgi:hypothetical protein
MNFFILSIYLPIARTLLGYDSTERGPLLVGVVEE